MADAWKVHDMYVLNKMDFDDIAKELGIEVNKIIDLFSSAIEMLVEVTPEGCKERTYKEMYKLVMKNRAI